MDCLTVHQQHEWIPDTHGWRWIISPLNNKIDFRVYGDQKVTDIPYELSERSRVWYYAKNAYLEHHCSIFHPEFNKPGGGNSFKTHVKLYSQSFPDHFLAIIDDQNHMNYKFINDKEYQAEEKWFIENKKGKIDVLFEDARKPYENTQKIEEAYTNYESQTSNGNSTIVLPLIGVIFGLTFIIVVLRSIPNFPR